MKVSSLYPYARPHVCGLVRVNDRIWIGTHGGLFKLSGESVTQLFAPEFSEVRAIGPCAEGFCVAARVNNQFQAYVCNADGERLFELSGMPVDDEPKCIQGGGSGFWLGGKNRIYRFATNTWKKVYGPGRCDTVELFVQDHTVSVSVKKHGPEETPIFLSSQDNGATWSESFANDCLDLVLASRGENVITRWRGFCSPETAGEKQGLALSAAAIEPDGSRVMVQGAHLKWNRPGHAALQATHPIFAECEKILVIEDRVLLAGPQGAYLLKLGSGEVLDLFAGVKIPETAGKTRKIYDLGHNRLLATATYGTFLSIDGGTWEPVKSDWTLLDCQAAVRIDAETHYMITKRALFMGVNNGTEWKHIALETGPHHLGELAGLLSTGEYLVLATKASGLFIAPLDNPSHMQFVKAGGKQAVKAVVALSGYEVMIATPEMRIHSVNLKNGVFSVLAQLPMLVDTLIKQGNDVLAVTKNALYSVTNTAVVDITPPGARPELHACAFGDQVLVWDAHSAWLRGSPEEPWMQRPDWPEVVKKAVLLKNEGCAIATDNRFIYRLPLPGAAMRGA